MPSPLQDLVVPESKNFVWVEHADDLDIGPFHFPADVPVPVGKPDNVLAHRPWLQVPFQGRPPVPASLEGDDEDAEANGEELLRAFTGGHLPSGSPDFYRLVDHVGRCLLIHASFGGGEPFHREVESIFAQVEKGAPLFDVMIRRAKGHVDEGGHFAEEEQGDVALYEFFLAHLLLYGAHLVSPTTPGVLYDLGVLTFDLAHRISFDEDEDKRVWQQNLSSESRYYLQLAMADQEIREQTPAYYLLGVNREVLDELGDAKSAYGKFLETPAARQYPHLRAEVRQRLDALNGDKGALS